MLPHLTLPDILNATFLQASEDGATLSDLQDGPMAARVGLSVAPANLSAWQAKEAGLLMSGIFGLLPTGLSPNVDLSQSLGSKLRLRLDSTGSTLFTLTWKQRLTPLKLSISALRASALRTFDSACTSVPTPDTHECAGPQNPAKPPLGGHSIRLQDMVTLASVPSPNCNDAKGGLRTNSNTPQLCDKVKKLTPVAKESQRDYKDSTGMSVTGVNRDGSLRQRQDQLPRQAALAGSGLTPIGGMGKTKSTGQLNPDYSRWLMGFPAEWASCADMVMQLSRHSRQRSSKQRKGGK